MLKTAMKTGKKAALVLAVLSVSAAPVFAAKPPSAKKFAQSCAAPPIVQVRESMPNPVLTNQKPASFNKKIKAGWRVQGLAELKRSYSARFQWEVLSSGSSHCLRLKAVSVDTGIIAPKIWINPQIRRNSCDYKVTLDHELRHVGNHNVYVRNFSDDLRRNLGQKLSGKSYMMMASGLNPNSAKSVLAQRTQAVIEQINAKHDGVADAKDRRMDTHNAYRNEYNICR